jgi:hypothetical protein
MLDPVSLDPLDEGHDFSLIGSGKRFGAIRRTMLDQYSARTSMRARKPRTDKMVATIATTRVFAKSAIALLDLCFFLYVYFCLV